MQKLFTKLKFRCFFIYYIQCFEFLGITDLLIIFSLKVMVVVPKNNNLLCTQYFERERAYLYANWKPNPEKICEPKTSGLKSIVAINGRIVVSIIRLVFIYTLGTDIECV